MGMCRQCVSWSVAGDWARPHLWRKWLTRDHVWWGRSKPSCQIVGLVTIIIITIIFIYHTITEHKIQKLNSVYKSMEDYQRSYSSLNWTPTLIKQKYLTSVIIISPFWFSGTMPGRSLVYRLKNVGVRTEPWGKLFTCLRRELTSSWSGCKLHRLECHSGEWCECFSQ